MLVRARRLAPGQTADWKDAFGRTFAETLAAREGGTLAEMSGGLSAQRLFADYVPSSSAAAGCFVVRSASSARETSQRVVAACMSPTFHSICSTPVAKDSSKPCVVEHVEGFVFSTLRIRIVFNTRVEALP